MAAHKGREQATPDSIDDQRLAGDDGYRFQKATFT
jgi:hypothetical protein